ncbi:MAG TPA: lysophospholipid acyltransferase family protein [Steroidobacteraceae bacterium]|jgi:KDO2-lipid IV(A) lauroyltransferase
MLTKVRPTPADAAAAAPAADPVPVIWWARALARLPLWMLYGFSSLIGFLAYRVFPYRAGIVRENLLRAFPHFTAAQLGATMHDYYCGFADMLPEIVKSVSISPRELRRRVRIVNLALAQDLLARGQSLMLVAAHQCNWEWMLLAVSLELGYPLDAAYKPFMDDFAEREMKKIRGRFGSRLVPAKQLLPDIIRRRDVVRCIAMVADQEPTTSEFKHWTRFLNRDTAFYMGPEEIARATHFPVFFMGFRRLARGYYEMQLTPLCAADEALAPGALTERYARLVEAQIHSAPADWPWSHKRWKLKKPLYQRIARGRLSVDHR